MEEKKKLFKPLRKSMGFIDGIVKNLAFRLKKQGGNLPKKREIKLIKLNETLI